MIEEFTTTICPACFKLANDELNTTDENGIETLLALDEDTFPTNLREHGLIGVNCEGVFEATYSANCTSCGFSLEYKHGFDLAKKKWQRKTES